MSRLLPSVASSALFALVCVLLLGGTAHASENYPAEVQKHLNLSYTPNCSLCHANGVTGYGTVTTPFGTAMRARGLVCCDITSLDTALDALTAEMNPFINDLQEGIDPNNPSAGAVPPITYGCSAGTTDLPNLGGVIAVMLTLLALLGVRRLNSGRER